MCILSFVAGLGIGLLLIPLYNAIQERLYDKWVDENEP